VPASHGIEKKENMEIRKLIQRAVKIFAAKPVMYLVTGAVAAYGSLFSFGLLAGPLIGGFLNIGLIHQRTGKPPALGDLTAGFQNLGNLFLLSLLLVLSWVGVSIVLPVFMMVLWWTYIPLVIGAVLLATWWMHVPALMVDQRMSLWRAMRESRARVTANGGFFPHLGFFVCVFVLPPIAIFGLSLLLPLSGLLHFLVCPVQFLALVSAYEEDFAQGPRVMHFYEDTHDARFR
jgi:hypothetical protein